jgi:hypothetical protein
VVLAAAVLALPATTVRAGDDGQAGSTAEQAAPVPQEEEPADALTNADVIQLVSLGLGDDLVIAKIEQAPRVDLDLETDDLVDLKEHGVSEQVIVKMLNRDEAERDGSASPAQAEPEAPAQQPVTPIAAIGPYGIVPIPGGSSSAPSPFYLLEDGKAVELTSLNGDPTSVWAGFVVLNFLEFPGTEAVVRTSNPRPTILAHVDESPERSQVYLVETDPDDDDDTRSVKIGKGKMFSASFTYRPDKDWTVPYESTEEEPGLWRIVPGKDLKPGEYGVYISGVLYDFAVDR